VKDVILEPKPTQPSRGRLTIYAAALVVFSVLAFQAHTHSYFKWDLTAARALQALPLPSFFQFMRILSLPGDGWNPYGICVLSVAAFLIFGRRAEAAGLTLSAAGGELLNRTLKFLIARPRPSGDHLWIFGHLTTLSFPSGHVTFYVCYCGFLFGVTRALMPKRSIARLMVLLLLTLVMVLIGVSRVALGAHWPSDVMGAYLFGGLWLAFCLELYRWSPVHVWRKS
jgi:undecaprenyl-diphosphatase